MNIILKNTHLWLFLVFLTIYGSVYAQDPFFNHYTEDEELPTNEVYGIIQDDNNIIYIATDKGLVTYDGYTFKTFTVNDSLGDNCILRMNKDDVYKRIWLTSLKNTCDYIEDGEIYKADFSDSLQKENPHEHFVQDITVTPDSQMFLNFNSEGLYKIENNELKKYEDHLKDAGDADICIFKVENGYYWDQLDTPEIDSNKKSSHFVKENKIYLKTHLTEETPHHRKELVEIAKDEFIFSYFNRLYHFRNDSLIEEQIIWHEIQSLFYDKDFEQIWVGTKDDGAWMYSGKSIKSSPRKYLRNKSITSILIDHEKNYWFVAREDGIYRANNLGFPTFKVSGAGHIENRITGMDTLGNYLFLGTSTGKLYKMNKNEKIELVDYKPDGKIRRLTATSHSSLLVFADSLYEINTSGKQVGFKILPTYPYAYLELDSTTSLLSITPGMRVYKNQVRDTLLKNCNGFLKIRQMFRTSDGRIHMSSQPYGLYTWYPGESEPRKAEELGLYQDKRVISYQEFRGNLAFCPAGYGIIIAGKDRLYEINTSDGLTSDMVDDLLVENDTLMWAATNKGVNRIEFFSDNLDSCRIEYYDTKTGLPSNRIYALSYFNNSLWAATGRGLVKMPGSTKDDGDLLNPIIEGIFANSDINLKDSVRNDTLTLGNKYPYTLKLNFKTISYREPHKIYYHYKLKDLNDEAAKWTTIQDLEIHYSNIEHGKYTLYLGASRHQLPDSSKLANYKNFTQVTFIVPPRFRDTTWYIILMITIFTFLLGAIILLVVKEIRNRERNKQRLLMAEKAALLSQMNPHFIFNSLNSIQHYIIEQDADNANLYLAKFSQLIRKTLDNSKKRKILLKEEIDTITLYLNLEKLRFEDNFDFDIKISTQLDQYNIVIPPMLLQPFVENAIWHGIMPLRSKGFVTITFEKEKDRMLVKIEDNGIGREKAAQKKRVLGHVPTGVKNVSERISLINKTIIEPIILSITDLKKPTGGSAGTLVELSVPLNDKNEKGTN